MRYNTIEEIPEWGQPAVKRLIEKGILKGDENGNLNLSEDMVRMFIFMARLGVY